MKFVDAYHPEGFSRQVNREAVVDGCRFILWHNYGWYLDLVQFDPEDESCPGLKVGTVCAEAYAKNFKVSRMEAWAEGVATRWLAGEPVHTTEPAHD